MYDFTTSTMASSWTTPDCRQTCFPSLNNSIVGTPLTWYLSARRWFLSTSIFITLQLNPILALLALKLEPTFYKVRTILRRNPLERAFWNLWFFENYSSFCRNFECKFKKSTNSAPDEYHGFWSICPLFLTLIGFYQILRICEGF